MCACVCVCGDETARAKERERGAQREDWNHSSPTVDLFLAPFEQRYEIRMTLPPPPAQPLSLLTPDLP